VPGAAGAAGVSGEGVTGVAGASDTRTLKLADDWLPTVSRAPQVTVVSPTGSSDPGAGVQPTEPGATPDGSDAVGSA
jgi:hypothetical protein